MAMLHSDAFHRGVHLGTSCKLMANHSGIFCSAITIITNNHNDSDAHCATHIAIHSAHECIVMITIIRNAFLRVIISCQCTFT